MYIYIYEWFQKWWYPTTMGFPSKNDHFGVFWGYHYFWKHPYIMFSMGGMLCKTIFFETPYMVLMKTRFGLQATRVMCVCVFFF